MIINTDDLAKKLSILEPVNCEFVTYDKACYDLIFGSMVIPGMEPQIGSTIENNGDVYKVVDIRRAYYKSKVLSIKVIMERRYK